MKSFKYVLLLSLALILSSCFHAQVTTDKQPSAQVIENSWAHTFVFGLVGPQPVDAAQQCDNGVAKVETKLSFLNGLVGGLTFNLYHPMTIKVTCASGSGMSAIESGQEESLTVAKDAADEDVANTIQKAADKSKELSNPVYVKFN